jgi:hypothetical protein
MIAPRMGGSSHEPLSQSATSERAPRSQAANRTAARQSAGKAEQGKRGIQCASATPRRTSTRRDARPNRRNDQSQLKGNAMSKLTLSFAEKQHVVIAAAQSAMFAEYLAVKEDYNRVFDQTDFADLRRTPRRARQTREYAEEAIRTIELWAPLATKYFQEVIRRTKKGKHK